MEDKFIYGEKLESNFKELLLWAKGHDIYPRVTKLGPELWGYVFKSSYDSYLIAINKNLTLETQRRVLIHEVYHILKHSPTYTYMIGMDMQHSPIEEEADLLALQTLATIQK
ncbi:ImmA/IrrE family metallo-endopeptidase [Natroniella acetigena]|uniref:ImmA/IrrE family metallo-endopeptidase n=1 Tax=Natroniella acetigena TaxID=52004 RepID=UPI00200A0947|nr:ImmA/IrrE family metallo-endopeptidase [Natroniella acetigena]MCK8827702.1 ImmA/IrrE family metallo-endopeptidase [Natroniella acetigena]